MLSLFEHFLDHLLERKGIEMHQKVPEVVKLNVVGLDHGVWVSHM